MNIYVASSWKNIHQPLVVFKLKEAGYKVYDFRHPDKDDNGFHWSNIDPDWESWDRKTYCDALNHDIARDRFWKDHEAMQNAHAFVMVLPCGNSSHLELGWAIGKSTAYPVFSIILMMDEEFKKDLMYKLADKICFTIDEVIDELKKEFE